MALYLPNLDATIYHLEGRTSMHIPGIIHHSSFYETKKRCLHLSSRRLYEEGNRSWKDNSPTETSTQLPTHNFQKKERWIT